MLNTSAKINNVKKIAILRANALGDFIVTLPAISAIKNAYPNAEIVLLGGPWHKSYLAAGRTPIDRVIVVPIKKGIREELNQYEDPETVADFISEMQQEQFDIVLNFQGRGVAANPFIKQFNARYTVGCVADNAQPLDYALPYYYYQNETIRFIELAQLIGATPVMLEPQVNILPQDIDEIKTLKVLIQDKPSVVLHPVAVDKRRMWPVENYALLADHFIEQNYHVIFTGDKKDSAIVEEIIGSMKYPAFNTCGNFSLGGLTALLTDAAVVIGPDTGPIHLARAAGATTVGIYWAPNLINWGPVTRGNHIPVVSWNMYCSLCGIVPNDPHPFEPQTTCTHEVSFVQDVSIESVIHAAEQLLNKNDNSIIVAPAQHL